MRHHKKRLKYRRYWYKQTLSFKLNHGVNTRWVFGNIGSFLNKNFTEHVHTTTTDFRRKVCFKKVDPCDKDHFVVSKVRADGDGKINTPRK